MDIDDVPIGTHLGSEQNSNNVALPGPFKFAECRLGRFVNSNEIRLASLDQCVCNTRRVQRCMAFLMMNILSLESKFVEK